MKLLVYTGRRKEPMPFMSRPDLYIYPFPHMVSRTKNKFDYFNFKLECEMISEITDHSVSDLSFENCALKKAQSLIQLKKDRYFILYSGGIDSTGLMVAILRTWDQADLKKITVVLTSHSIYENPSFYKDYISQFQLYNYMQGLGPLLQVSNSIIITGELGDQLFGSGILMPACQKYGDEILKSSYIENGARVIDQYTRADSRRGDNYGDVLFEYLKPLADECPFKIQTCFDFFWWFNFTQEWQFAKFKFYESYDVPMSVRYGTNIVHFYDSLEFQKWSISNHDKKIKDGWSSYKQANKEFIYQFTKNDFHLKQLKLQSLKNTYFFQNFRVATTEKHESLDQYSDLEKYAK